MLHPADSMSELCQCGKHNGDDGERIPMYYSSREEAELIVIDRSTNLSVCRRVDEIGLPTIRYKVFCNRNCNKV